MFPLVDDGTITLKEDTHQYFDRSGQEYNSVSSVISSVTEPFNAKLISRNMTSTDAEAKLLREEWKATNRRSIDWGNKVHKECENFIKYGSVKDSAFNKLEDQIYRNVTKRYARNHAERILCDQRRYISGTSDHFGERSKIRNRNLVIDINDFKTNLARGVRNETAKLDDKTKDIIKYGNRYLLHPLDHLEASDYVKYCLQLSIYGVMLEGYGVRVGAMNLYYVNPDLEISEIFVPYMRMEAMLLMDNFITLRSPNGEVKSQYLKRKDSSGKGNGEDISQVPELAEHTDDDWL